MNNLINVMLNNNQASYHESDALSIQLANVIESQDCRIDIIAETPEFEFSVYNSNLTELSKSVQEDDFIQYHVSSSTFHLEDTPDFSIKIVFRSSKNDVVSIKRIVLTFMPNENSAFGNSPGFDSLLKQIDEKGVTVPNTEVKYLLTDNNKVFVKIPNELASERFLVHIKPANIEDIPLDRRKAGFDNKDFTPGNNKTILPKPFDSKSAFMIIHFQLPSYPYLDFDMGQFKEKTRFWRIKVKKE